MTPSDINILIACEESQEECKAFRERGFNAYSCDLQRPRLNPAWHILGNVIPYLYDRTEFFTMDGVFHHVPRWNLVIAHPPCTYLCKLSSCQLVKHGQVNPSRLFMMERGRTFFLQCLNARADFVAVENPLPMARARLPTPSFFIQPYWFGARWSKKTLFWSRGLPPLLPTIINPDYKCFVSSRRGKYRARSFPEVSAAMATQWGDFLLDHYSKTPINKPQD